MSLYYMDDNVQLFNENILDITELEIPASSVDLIVTSPPYNVDIQYNSHEDGKSYEKYLTFTKQWLEKCHELANSLRASLLS